MWGTSSKSNISVPGAVKKQFAPNESAAPPPGIVQEGLKVRMEKRSHMFGLKTERLDEILGGILMGIFDSLQRGLSEQNEEFERYKDRYRGLSDDKLKKLYLSSSGVKKLAIAALLKGQ